jgi:hypothetical protein
MRSVLNDKLVATVVEVVNFADLYPASALNGQIGLDVRVEKGSLTIGKAVMLSGPDSGEEVRITGIEMLSNLHDPNVVRIHCSKPKVLSIPIGKTERWIISEL